eukprot:CAMPEP_0202699934 /NCGR_PEP_ID=MMETSP1385-20130828/13147_1 /ASSEMBLY_ACC=CAM_ASM_000861 /TAXON_ID=933848 /ORGANISM="Elphidium margaritaceum" /LENGTH=522 /DNA_ID=CAMNT_0049357013 /DNA_START=54 /DNA_END=1622 /DNA_ORIENTATION=-
MIINVFILSSSLCVTVLILLYVHTDIDNSSPDPTFSASDSIPQHDTYASTYASRHLLHESAKHDKSQMITHSVQGTVDDVHIVFTTGCSGYQNWQSETLLYSWARVQHPGRITRIIAGCKDDTERSLANRTAVPNDDNRILFYFVPDYTPTANDSKGVKSGHRPFHYFNKPHGMKQWIASEFERLHENVIVLIDPDMIVLRPFLLHMESTAKEWAEWQHAHTKDGDGGSPRDLYVREGHAVAQKYGIGAKWVKWSGFCDERASCRPSDRDAWKYYSVGPPYILHKNDWARVAPKWVEYSPLALEYEPQPSILAEMYSYVIACAYFDLKHEYLFSMLSDPGSSGHMENVDNLNWGFLHHNAQPAGGVSNEAYHEFHIIHYCQGFWLGETRNTGTIRNGGWNWHKGHVPQQILTNCEIPLLVMLDDTDTELVQMLKARDATKDKRHYWILYHIYKYVDEAVQNYRLKYCPSHSKRNSDGGDADENPAFQFKLVLQQPEADTETHRRMNYVLGEYDNKKKSWFGH